MNNQIYEEVMKRDKGVCSKCKCQSNFPKIETRESFSYVKYFEKRIEPSARDFITLCPKCAHNLIETRKMLYNNGFKMAAFLELSAYGIIEKKIMY